LAQKIFRASLKEYIKKSEFWLASDSSFNKPLSPNRRFTGSVPNLGGTGGLDLRREAYGWIRWNEVSSCKVVGGEKALKSSEFISISGIAEKSLKILFFV